MSARPLISDGDPSGTTLYIDDHGDPNNAYTNNYAYAEYAHADNDTYRQQNAYSRRGNSPATGRIPVRRGGPPAVRRPSSTPLLLRATVVIGLVAATGVGVFRAYGSGSALANTALTADGTTSAGADAAATAQDSCRVRQSVTSRSQGRFTSMVTITNTSQVEVDGWTLTWSYPDADADTMPRLRDGWNATVSSDATGGQATAVDLSRVIPANGSTTIGFVGSAQGTAPTPAGFALNGVMCR